MWEEGGMRYCSRQRRVSPEGEMRWSLRSLSASDTGRMSANQWIHKRRRARTQRASQARGGSK